jgi:hypothetical protein
MKRYESRPTTLLMTATIRPPAGVPSLHRTDPAVRLQDYVSALRFYLSLRTSIVKNIVFADNSNSDLSALQAIVKESQTDKDVEMISFPGLDYPASNGRAFGEFKLIDHVVNKSRIIRQLGPREHFWKTTGRLRVVNLERLVRTMPEGAELYVDLRPRRRWCELRTFAVTVGAYRKCFEGCYEELSEPEIGNPHYFLFDRIRSWAATKELGFGIVQQMKVVPRIEGISGWRNQEYLQGKYKWIYWGRVICRKSMPWLNI